MKDNRNCTRPKAGFQHELIEELKSLTSGCFNVQRYIVPLFDEMKVIQNSRLTNSRGLIGYLDLGDPDLSFDVLKKVDEIASHALLFFVRGLTTQLKFSLAYFAC